MYTYLGEGMKSKNKNKKENPSFDFAICASQSTIYIFI